MHQTSAGTKKTKRKQQFQQLLRSGPIVPGNFNSFGFFGACAGLVHLVVCFFLVFFGACAGLVTLTSQNIDRHQKFQQLLRWTHSSWIFFIFFWCLCRFDASSGLFFFFVFFVFVQVSCIYWFVCFFLMPVQVLVILDCVCLDLGHLLNLYMFQRSKHTVVFE